MGRIILVLALLISGAAQAQHGPMPSARPSYPLVGVDIREWLPIPGYTKINSRYQWLAGAFDSGLHVPQYNGTPSGVRGGVWVADGAIAMDTTNSRFYIYSGGAWNRVANYSELGGTYTASNGITLSGSNFKLGGTLSENTVVDAGALIFEVYGQHSSSGGSGIHIERGMTVIGDHESFGNDVKLTVNDTASKFYFEGGNVGIGTTTPSELLDVNGKTKTSTLQVTTGATNGYVLTSDASGNATWGAVASTAIKIADTLRYTIATNYGADPTGTNGSAGYIQDAIDDAVVLGYNATYIPPGTYKIESVDSALILPIGFTLFGIPGQSELKTTTNGSTASLATAMNFIKLPNGNCVVKDLVFRGNGKTTYTFPWTSQNGVWVYSDKNSITGCYFINLRGAGILGVHPSLSLHSYNSVSHNLIDSSTIGIFTYAGSEYWTFNDITAINGTIGINEWGANNNYTGCHFNYNSGIGGSIQGNGGNSDHSYFTNCVFNHNAVNLNIDNIVLSVTFTGGGSWSAPSTVDQSVGVSFSNFQWGTSANLTVTASSTDKYTVLNNCFRATSSPPTFTESGTGKIMDIAPFNSSISTFNVNKGVKFTGLLSGAGTKDLRIDGSGNVTTSDTTYRWNVNGNPSAADGNWIGNSTNFDFTVKTNNTSRINVLKTGELGVGTAGFTGYKFVMYSTGVAGSTYSMLLRDNSGTNLWSLRDDGNTVQGKNISTVHNFWGKTYFGDGTTTPTSAVHLPAGTATASTAPLKFTSGTNLTVIENGAVEYNGSRLFVSSNGTRQNVLQGLSGSFSGVGTATTVFTVTFGGTQPNATYQVNVTPTAALSAALFYVTNKTTTTFDVTYLAGLTGTVTFDWSIYQ